MNRKQAKSPKVSVKLKPCPFCGGGAAYCGAKGATYIQCVFCFAAVRLVRHKYAAERAWNTRDARGKK